jgi:hypothetical protein
MSGLTEFQRTVARAFSLDAAHDFVLTGSAARRRWGWQVLTPGLDSCCVATGRCRRHKRRL